jgi:hypothetical protein
MTTIVRTRQPLEVLSMSNPPERRHSKRLAGGIFPFRFPSSAHAVAIPHGSRWPGICALFGRLLETY